MEELSCSTVASDELLVDITRGSAGDELVSEESDERARAAAAEGEDDEGEVRAARALLLVWRGVAIDGMR